MTERPKMMCRCTTCGAGEHASIALFLGLVGNIGRRSYCCRMTITADGMLAREKNTKEKSRVVTDGTGCWLGPRCILRIGALASHR